MKIRSVVLALLLLIVVAAPAEAKKAPPPPPPPTAEPILLIQGYPASAPSVWATFQSRLTAAGRTSYTMSLPSGDNTVNANLIKSFAASNHWTKFALVGWSMGGLSSRWYVKELGGSALVDKLVLLGSPNYGITGLPCILPATLGGQMCVGSSFLKTLDATPLLTPPTVYTTISSTTDGTVSLSSSELPGANNLVVTGPTHEQLGTDQGVFNLALQALK